jgi:hypothetical protein
VVLNRKRIDLDPGFNLETERPRLVWPHEVKQEYGIPVWLQNQLDEEGILPVYKLGLRSVLYRADVERVVASLPPRLPEAPDAAATVEAELESVLRVIRLVRRARRMPLEDSPAAA